MPQQKNLHHNKPLTNVSTAYIQSATDFIASQAFGTVPVQKQSDVYWQYPKEYWMSGGAQVRAAHSQSAGSDYELTQDGYRCDVIAWHDDVDDQERANADSEFSLDRDATEIVTQTLLIKREIDFANTFLKTGVWASNNNTVAKWDDYGMSTPLADVQAARRAIKKSTAQTANVMIVGEEVFDVLVLHPDITGRMSDNTDRIADLAILRNYFGVERFLVASGVVNTAPTNENQAFSGEFIAGKHVLLAHAAQRPSLKKPSAAYVFQWTAFAGAGAAGNMIEKFRRPSYKSDRIEGHMSYDMKVVSPDLGYFFPNILS